VQVPWESIFPDCSTGACLGCWARPWNI